MRRSTVSVYGYRRGAGRPIYGCNSAAIHHSDDSDHDESPPVGQCNDESESDCECESSINPLVALQNLLNFLNTFRATLSNYYVAANINAPLSAKMSVSGTMSFRLFARITWGRLNAGVQFDKTCHSHINGLKDVYLANYRDWHMDPILLHASLSIY